MGFLRLRGVSYGFTAQIGSRSNPAVSHSSPSRAAWRSRINGAIMVTSISASSATMIRPTARPARTLIITFMRILNDRSSPCDSMGRSPRASGGRSCSSSSDDLLAFTLRASSLASSGLPRSIVMIALPPRCRAVRPDRLSDLSSRIDRRARLPRRACVSLGLRDGLNLMIPAHSLRRTSNPGRTSTSQQPNLRVYHRL